MNTDIFITLLLILFVGILVIKNRFEDKKTKENKNETFQQSKELKK